MQVARSRRAAATMWAFTAVLLAVMQFLPFASLSESFLEGGARAEVDAYVWKATLSTKGFGEDQTNRTGWYEDDFDGQEGIGFVRVGAPLSIAGLGAAVGASALVLVRPRWAVLAGLAASALVALAAAFLAMGIDDLFDGRSEWGAAFYLAVTATLAAMGSATLAGVALTRPDGRR